MKLDTAPGPSGAKGDGPEGLKSSDLSGGDS